METVLDSRVFASRAEELAYKRRWIALLILSLSLTLIIIDSTIVNIAFPTIRKTFGASFADAEWVNSIYSLVFGAALITWGKLGDQYGRRNIFIGGAALFVLASAGIGFSPSIGTLIFFRALQGMGGAMMSPATLSIVSATFKGKERNIAFGVWGATAGVSAAIGPILGGWLIEYGTGVMAESWRLAFLVNIPIGVIAILGSVWAIQESRDTTIKHRIDWLGILLATLSIGAFVFGAIEGQNYGWLEAKKVFTLGSLAYPSLAADATIPGGTVSFVPFVFAFSAVMFLAFIFVELGKERNNGEPLFEFGLLKYRSFRFGLLTVLIVALGEFGVILTLSIFFQLAKGLGAFETGLQFLPFALVAMVAAPSAGFLSNRFGPRWVVTIGMALEAIALFWLSQIISVDAPTLLWPLLVYGAGVGLAVAQLANIVLSDIPLAKVGVASGANNTIRQLGASIGIAVIGAVLFGNFASASKPLVEKMTVFEDFSARVQANDSLSNEARVFGSQFATAGAMVKEAMIKGLDNNEGYDTSLDPIDQAIAQIPPIGKAALRLQGVNLDDAAVVSQIKTELAPDVAILKSGIQHTLGEGLSQAAHLATLLGSIFLAGGALSSLMLPNTKRAAGAAVGH
ncbi:MAG TPA: MFS transporter [Phototrophicaceae bacterium]|nr:MFS transporter [Phototrophicaceae bacterium]